MRVLQFGFSGRAVEPQRSRELPEHCVALHGNPRPRPARGLVGACARRAAPASRRELARAGIDEPRARVGADPARLLDRAPRSRSSRCRTSSASAARRGSTRPGTVEGNWRWRLEQGSSPTALAERLREATTSSSGR